LKDEKILGGRKGKEKEISLEGIIREQKAIHLINVWARGLLQKHFLDKY